MVSSPTPTGNYTFCRQKQYVYQLAYTTVQQLEQVVHVCHLDGGAVDEDRPADSLVWVGAVARLQEIFLRNTVKARLQIIMCKY